MIKNNNVTIKVIDEQQEEIIYREEKLYNEKDIKNDKVTIKQKSFGNYNFTIRIERS